MRCQASRPFLSKRLPRGVALLSTLIVLALVTVLVVSFFIASRSMREQATYSLSDFRLGTLRDVAINASIEQLREATTQAGEMWASQPGAIRTYSRTTGQPSQIFKLYSHEVSRLQGLATIVDAATLNLESDVPANWKAQTSAYVDLNEPEVFSVDGQMHFPIVDPRLDDGGTHVPEGFAYTDKLASSGTSVAGVIPSAGGTSAQQRLPMPVRWIYLLRDGTRGWINGAGKFQPLSGTDGPKGSNPIVGRMAWWVDDESAKININTASEAIPWDTPRAATPEDVEYARQTPVKNEVQRFSGHPATTCLSTIFFPNELLDPATAEGRGKLMQIYDLAPRIGGRETGYLAVGTARRQPVAFDDDRLYATVDEMLYAPDRSRQPLMQTLGAGRLRQLRFLLTANSSAPETTAAGTPRMSLWPVFQNDTDANRTAYDRLLTHAATIAGRPYYFRRNDAKTSTNEFAGTMASNANLERYLLSLAARNDMGYAKSFIQKYDGDVDATGREVENMAVGLVSFLETIRDTNLHDTTIAPSGQPVIPYGNFTDLFRGTKVPGQVPSTNPSNFPNARGQLNDHELRLGPVGREFTLSEFGVVFSYAAEHKSGGVKVNPTLVDKLQLPVGYKAIQGAAIFEGFCPSQGYTMISPAAGLCADFTLVGINGSRPYSKVTGSSPLAGTVYAGWGPSGSGSDTSNRRWLGGRDLEGSNAMPSSGLTIPNLYDKTWWVGWGGSGGRFVFTGSDTAGLTNPGSITNLKDPVTGQGEIPAIYTRGYFIIPSADETMTLGMLAEPSGKEAFVEIGIWARRDGVDRTDHCKFGKFPQVVLPVPQPPSNLRKADGSPMTWRERMDQTRNGNFTDPEVIDPSDTVRTLVVRHNDYRLALLRRREHIGPYENRTYTTHPDYFDSSKRQVHSFTRAGGVPEAGAVFRRGLVNTPYATDVQPDFPVDPADPVFTSHLGGSYPYPTDPEVTRDWNNGTGIVPDGAYWIKPDDLARTFDGAVPPYFNRKWDGVNLSNGEETISPNQQIPSAVIFGGIPSAAGDGVPWTTYLFRPDLNGNHLGAAGRGISGPLEGAPPDHRLLDWFWMPVVQPYAVSEPFSTAGKINLNYRLAPFNYITRATGLHAIFKSERLLAIPTDAGMRYKDYAATASNTGWRMKIDAKETLKQFENRFNSGKIFRFASEICEMQLVPEGQTLGGMQAFWAAHKLTGDNTLERPYAGIYPRLTTQSNVFTIHLMVQTLNKARSTALDEFVEGQDMVTGTYRGEALVERYIDPNDPDLPDAVGAALASTPAAAIDASYAWRIRHVRRFAP
ncbi:Verru_Chthon cassette protein A [Verrucomicrobium sp. BvORR034]|uniref:Verru_Chthon cassette protein A n=1 Tax=Verrucomicrobium sp. BvORR034 TaxID=1396418 RepID=UPI000679730F|nr:Verru_Chthon cassette protein A [Verrucomicrobium sp. BvORR034]